MNKQAAVFLLLIFTFGWAQADWPSQSERLEEAGHARVDRTVQPRATGNLGSPVALNPGEVLEVRVSDLPANTTSASFALGHGIFGLVMRPEADGAWVGRFAVLPALAGRTLEPIVTVRLADGTEFNRMLPSRQVKTTSVKDGDGFIVNSDGKLIFVFDETIQLDTVEVKAHSSQTVLRPRYENNYFALPDGTRMADIETIRALSIHGEELEIKPRG
ncbi:MAG: hypothetical protein KC800_03740 [Candidatus Eremiobacteraeota bacterium]|nr:hypothetical protein [Candidatus Eremiobacteraeota bacterium]